MLCNIVKALSVLQYLNEIVVYVYYSSSNMVIVQVIPCLCSFFNTGICSFFSRPRSAGWPHHTMDVLSPFISVLCHSDWLFHRESCPRLDVVHPGRAWYVEISGGIQWIRMTTYDKMLKWLILTYVMRFLAIEFNVFVSEVVIAF